MAAADAAWEGQLMPAPSSTSLIDAVDEANRPVGAVPRGRVFRDKANFRTTHVLVFNSRGELLLQRLSASRERHALRWGSSVAGYLHLGETYDAAATRRLHEELGLATPLRRVGVTPMPDEGVTKFIGVFETLAERPRVADPVHIDALEFWPLERVDASIEEAADQFTASLLHVLQFWRAAGPGSDGA